MIQHPCILKNNILHRNNEHLSKQGPLPFFHSDTNLALGNALVHPFEKNPALVVTVKLVWLLFLNIFFFNFILTPSKSLRFRKFRRNNVHRRLFSLKSTTVKVALLFLLDVRSPKRPHFFFCGCLSPTIAHLRNLFLLSTPVAQMLLTPRWVSRRKHVTWLFITVGGTHPINRRTTFSPYLHLVEEATYFPFFTPWYGSNYMPLYRYGYGYWTIQPMPLQEPKFYISLDSACFLFVGHCYDLLKR